MNQIVPNSSEEGVILNNPSSKKKPQQAPLRKNHFFTYNNYKEEEIDAIVSTLKKFAKKGKIQSEIGENGTPHLQGMIWCEKKCRDTEFKLPKQIHWESLKDVDNIRDYCGKDETHDGKYRISWGFPKEIKLITPNKWWQLEILDKIKEEADNRTIYWYWSRFGGVGKSQFVKYCVVKHNTLYFDEGKKSDIMNVVINADESKLDVMMVDLPRSTGNHVSYKALESLKNGLIYSGKYEGGYRVFNSPHIFVFANQPPKESTSEEGDLMSTDKWIIKNIDE